MATDGGGARYFKPYAPGYNALPPNVPAALREVSEAEWRDGVIAEERHQAVWEARHPEAVAKARALLLRFLNPRQAQEFKESGGLRFTVKDAHQHFVISRRRSGNITWINTRRRSALDRDPRLTPILRKYLKKSEQTIQTLCIWTDAFYPLEDQMLAQKITIESARDEFWRLVNRHDWRTPTLEECFA